MSNHSQTVIVGGVGDAAALAAELEDSLPSRYSIDPYTAASPGSVSSGSWTLIASRTGIALAGDEVMDCWASCNFSGPTASETIEFGLFWGGVQIDSLTLAVPTGATGGDGLKQQAVIRWPVVDYAGTSDLIFKARRASGVGTFVTTNRSVQYFINKKRA